MPKSKVFCNTFCITLGDLKNYTTAANCQFNSNKSTVKSGNKLIFKLKIAAK